MTKEEKIQPVCWIALREILAVAKIQWCSIPASSGMAVRENREGKLAQWTKFSSPVSLAILFGRRDSLTRGFLLIYGQQLMVKYNDHTGWLVGDVEEAVLKPWWQRLSEKIHVGLLEWTQRAQLRMPTIQWLNNQEENLPSLGMSISLLPQASHSLPRGHVNCGRNGGHACA